MSGKIEVLPQTLINQIAAGEVIVRPASVVKELVENAFDAEARHVRVEVSDDSRSITVTDDGVGMDEANARRAILRNATSKIRTLDDLENLFTRGFRGEALASIVAVSRFEMLTRQKDDKAGTRLTAEGGKIMKVEPVGTAAGTTFHVRDIFYNTPARRKFLKSPGAEFNALQQILTQQALSHPEVGVTCVREGKVRFDLPAEQSLHDRIVDLLGSTVRDRLVEVDYERDGFGVKGFVAKPEASRRDRRWQFFMVNGRPIGARQLSFPLQEAYHGFMMKGKFPVAVLDLQMERPEVDVNVHPTKEEVRFEEERKVFGLMHRAVSEALAKAQLIPTIEMRADKVEDSPEEKAPEKTEVGPRLQSMFSGGTARDFRKSKPSPAPRSDNSLFSAKDFPYERPKSRPIPRPELPKSDDDVEEASEVLAPTRPEPMRLTADEPPLVLGQVGTRYIATEWGGHLLLIDQHAAHERMVYQDLKERAGRNEKPPVQPLMLPIEIEVATAEREAFEMIVPLLREMGVEINVSDSGAASVSALPTDCDSIDVAALVRDVLDRSEDVRPESGGVESLRDTVMTRMACHSAIRSGQRLSRQEMEALVREMVARQLSFTCPHGRPTMVLLRREQLDRQFGRLG